MGYIIRVRRSYFACEKLRTQKSVRIFNSWKNILYVVIDIQMSREQMDLSILVHASPTSPILSFWESLIPIANGDSIM